MNLIPERFEDFQSQDKIIAFNLIQEAFIDIETQVLNAFKILEKNLRKTHY